MRVMGKNRMMGNEKQKKWIFLLLFSISFFAVFAVTYACFFFQGKSFIWDYDGIKQHYAALAYLGKYYREAALQLLHGNFTLPMFDFSMGMGEDIITTLNFYGLGEPLTFLAAFVPQRHTELLYQILVVLRIYLAGLSFAWFCRQKGKGYAVTWLGALIYAFSGYVLHVAVKHPFFVVPMIFLPVSVVGLERALEKKRLTLLIVSVFLTAWNGFYFFYMNTLFLAIYTVVHVACRNRKGGFAAFARDLAAGVVRVAFAYVTGTAMAAVLFLPTIAAYVSSARSGASVVPDNLFFFGGKRLASILAGLIGTPRITWDYLGLAAVVLPALIVLFAGKWKRHLKLKVNIIIWSVFMLLPLGGYVLNGFSYVSGRFLYLVTFLYAFAVVEMLPELLRLNRRRRFVCAGAAMVYGVMVVLSGSAGLWYRWFGFAMLLMTLAVLFYGPIRRKKNANPLFVLPVLAGVVVLNLAGNGWLLFDTHAQGYVSEFMDAGTAWAALHDSPEAETAKLYREDGAEFFRVDARKKSTENASMVNGTFGVSSYFSISNPNRIQYLLEADNGGVLDSMFKIEGLDGRACLMALASVKYYALPKGAGEEEVPYGFEFVREYRRGKKTWKLYENQQFLPFGITFDSYIRASDVRTENGIQRQMGMLKTVVLGDETVVEGVEKQSEFPVSDVRDIPFTIQKQQGLEVTGDTVVVKKAGAKLGIICDSETDGDSDSEWYVSLSGYEITKEGRNDCSIRVSSGGVSKTMQALGKTWNWYFGRETLLYHLGRGQGNAGFEIRFSRPGTFRLSDLKVYVQEMSEYEKTVAERKQETLQKVAVGTNRVNGEITVSKNKILFLPIPYSTGWQAKVDGKEAAILPADTAYMALELEPGRHQIELSYRTPYLATGGVLSLAGFLVFDLMCAFHILKYKRWKFKKHEGETA